MPVTAQAPRSSLAFAPPSVPLWSLIGGLAGAYVIAGALGSVRFRSHEVLALVGISGAGLLAAAFYTVYRPDPRIARMMRGAVELLLLSFLCGSLSYAAAALGRPLWDSVFDSWDKALGFHWRVWLAFLEDRPSLHRVLVVAYHSMIPQLVLAVIALSGYRAYARLDTFLLAFGLTAAATVAISGYAPAVSPLVHYGITPVDYPSIQLAVPLEFASQVTALRDGALRMVDLSGAQGLVTFPSFHTASAVLLLLAFWGVPVFRWAGLALNAVLILSVPIEGSHYLVDVFGGIVVACAAWRIAQRVTEREALRERGFRPGCVAGV